MKLRIFLSAVTVAALLLFSGCGSQNRTDLSVNAHFDESPTRFAATYDYFSGIREHDIYVAAGKTVEVQVDVTTQDGTLHLSIVNEDGDGSAAYTGQALETGSFTVTLTEPGNYKATVQAEKHQGGYTLDWSRQ